MYCFKNMAVSIIVCVSLFTAMTIGPLADLNDNVQILEFGTSTQSISQIIGDAPPIIENSGTPALLANRSTSAASPAAKNLAAEAKAAAYAEALNGAGAKQADLSFEEKAREIAEGTPLDLKTSRILIQYAEQYDLNPSLILSVMEVESNFNQYTVGSSRDRGYMQIIPATEKWLANGFGKELGISYDPSRIFDPEYNIGLAAAYLNDLKEKHGEDYHRILSEYNRGAGNLKKYFKKNRTYSTSYSRKVLSREKRYLVYNQ